MTAISITSRRNWDPVVKLTHWTIAAAVLVNGALTEGGSWPHIWVGYALCAILALRLLWGLVGPAEARFSAFPPSPAKAIAHIRDIRAGKNHMEPSHNPLGALMVYAIWGTLGVIIATGITMAGLPPHAAEHHKASARAMVAIASDADEDEDAGGSAQDSPLKDVHETAADLLYVLIALHLAGVIFETRRSGRQIVLAMIPGRR
ncbi:cytochrome b/b6 domain-containing protein [Novosphingobium sp.]|uniref:cytochrome b/b6 domain-containing protein n=1 Tax=Novosphingobium sp. TaxID=1874826 RepID=UPI0033418EEA